MAGTSGEGLVAAAAATVADDSLVEDTGPMPVPLPNAAAPAVPTFTPRLKSEGHQKICQVLLPLLFGVCGESSWCTKSPRDQVREALDSPMAAHVAKVHTSIKHLKHLLVFCHGFSYNHLDEEWIHL